MRCLMQGQYASVMIAHEVVEDDAPWIKWLRHAAQVDSHLPVLQCSCPKAPFVSHILNILCNMYVS